MPNFIARKGIKHWQDLHLQIIPVEAAEISILFERLKSLDLHLHKDLTIWQCYVLSFTYIHLSPPGTKHQKHS